jgi:hypothetical protein
MTTFEEKAGVLRTKRAALVSQHQTLTEQLGQVTVGLHQIDGALAILGELETEAATPVDGVVETPAASRNGLSKRSAV